MERVPLREDTEPCVASRVRRSAAVLDDDEHVHRTCVVLANLHRDVRRGRARTHVPQRILHHRPCAHRAPCMRTYLAPARAYSTTLPLPSAALQARVVVGASRCRTR